MEEVECSRVVLDTETGERGSAAREGLMIFQVFLIVIIL